jgi:hypothetical protein
VVLDESPAGRIHNDTGILRVTNFVGKNLHQWIRDSNGNNIFVKGRALRLFRTSRKVSPLVKQQLETALHVWRRKSRDNPTLYVPLNCSTATPPPNYGRAFSIEYEREFLSQSEAYVSVVYEHKLTRIEVSITQSLAEPQLYLTFYSTQIGQRSTE